jgi:trimeric autotransporter adhesin
MILALRTPRAWSVAVIGLLLAGSARPLSGAAGDEHWDTQFTATGFGFGLKVAAAGGNLYLAGNFNQIGGVSAANIARWDGTNWHPLGAGVDGTVTCLAATDRFVYVAAGGVGRWDGTNWSAMGEYFHPVVLAASGDDVYGADARSAGPFGPYIYKWNGTSWEALGGGLWGPFCIEVSKPINAIAVHGEEVYIGGRFEGFGGATNLAKWDGVTWSAVGGGVDLVDTDFGSCEVVSSLVYDGGRLYVGGMFNRAGALRANVANVACWDGTNWSTFNTGLGQGFHHVKALAVVGGTNLYAGGWFEIGDTAGITNIARWTGTGWTPMGSGATSGWVEYSEVNSLAARDDDLFVAGGFTTAGNQPAGNYAVWHQTAPPPRLNATLAGAAIRLEWPARYTSYRLQEATNVAGPWLTYPPFTPTPDPRFSVTKSLTGGSRFYRLNSE